MVATYRATMMSADTGANQVYGFTADHDLFRKPARQIVRAFMDHIRSDESWNDAPSYKISSATKKSKKGVVMAMGSLLLKSGELPFLVMISPEPRQPAVARMS